MKRRVKGTSTFQRNYLKKNLCAELVLGMICCNFLCLHHCWGVQCLKSNLSKKNELFWKTSLSFRSFSTAYNIVLFTHKWHKSDQSTRGFDEDCPWQSYRVMHDADCWGLRKGPCVETWRKKSMFERMTDKFGTAGRELNSLHKSSSSQERSNCRGIAVSTPQLIYKLVKLILQHAFDTLERCGN